MKAFNRLVDEASPYLLSHSNNPVNWYPWSDEAFSRAKAEDKPIFLSIGYSSCHWCHVMERESFENNSVAETLNDSFICIKVDREERPDIDNFFMDVSLLLTGRGGWPLHIIMTPDMKPFYAATYIPPYGITGQPGIMELVSLINEIWNNNRDRVNSITESVLKRIGDFYHGDTGVDFRESNIEDAYMYLSQTYDHIHGGFGRAPRFPCAHNLLFLFDFWRIFNERKALDMSLHTLKMMRIGGIYDQLGFGFHRYSTDSMWRVPHFEKMIYDQAMMIMVYVEAFSETGEAFYLNTVNEIITYVYRNLKTDFGAFMAGEDADTGNEEGNFYLWTTDDFTKCLGDDAEEASEIFNVNYEGNFTDELTDEKNGKNILYLSGYNSVPDSFRGRLLVCRNKRERPFKDEQVLLNWNALMIAALARTGRVLARTDYIADAEKSMEYLIRTMTVENIKILHMRDKKRCIPGNIDDYANLIWALFELYNSTGRKRYLSTAEACLRTQLEFFHDSGNSMWYYTPADNSDLPGRSTEFYDGDIPSGFSVTYQNFLRMHLVTGEERWLDYARLILNQSATRVNSFPAGYTMLLSGVMKSRLRVC